MPDQAWQKILRPIDGIRRSPGRDRGVSNKFLVRDLFRNYLVLEVNRWPQPGMVSQLCTSDCLGCFTPSFTCVASGPAPPHIQQTLALRIELEKLQYSMALSRIRKVIAADKLVVYHAAIRQGHGTPGSGPNSRTQRQPGTEHQRIQKVTVEAKIIGHRAVVIWTWQR